jgi:type 1 fimbriae regulatory protein FimB/type 1 fimbriae regulatory protein FimE
MIVLRTEPAPEGPFRMRNPNLRLVTPVTVNRTVMPKRPKNSELRSREYLTANEVEALIAAARKNRYGHRDGTMLLIAFRHGLRASELVGLRWEQVDFNRAVLHVRRVKGGTPSVHPLSGAELRALRRLQREAEASPFVFVSERGAPFATAGFARMMERVGTSAGLALKVHPHMLRHACGFALANAGHDTRSLQAYLGHANIQHTVRYTELAPERFKGFWRD